MRNIYCEFNHTLDPNLLTNPQQILYFEKRVNVVHYRWRYKSIELMMYIPSRKNRGKNV